MTEPTDAEILELASQYWHCLDETESATEIELVRAALAKWGQPAQATDSVQEDAARWNAWSQAMAEASSTDIEPEFLRVLSETIGDAEAPITLQQLNAWTDAARAAQKEGKP